jgi:hypothetical protein
LKPGGQLSPGALTGNKVKLLKKLLIIIPVAGLILVTIFMPARQVSIEGIGTLSFKSAVTLTFGSEVANASPDWLPGWSYRRPISLSPATPVADYQVLVTLTTSTMGNPYANIKADGSDIRFTGSDGAALQDYWVESWDNTGTSQIWVEVTASGTSTIYMYNGNAAAGSTSDGDATFDFFDDFNGDLSKWTIDPENTDKVYIDNGALRQDPDSSQTKNSYYDTRIRTVDYKILDGVIEYSVYLAGSTSSSPRIIHQLGFRVQSLNFEDGYCWRLQNSAADGGHLRFTGIASWTPFGTAYPATTGNVWHTVKEVVSGSTYTGYVDGGSAYSGTNNTKLTADYLVSHVHGVSLTASSYVLVDNIRVRKYASPEPTATVGGEEYNSPPDPPGDLGPTDYIDGRWVDDNTPTLNFTQSDPDDNTVNYTIQIDDDDDFSSPVADYTSGLLAEGATSFTSPSLPDGDYYWRVMSTDENGVAGAWSVANGGAIAFRLNTAAESGQTPKNEYRTNENVYVSGNGFPPFSNVNVYVVSDYHWHDGDPIPPDSGDIFASKTFTTDIDGEIVNELIWHSPLEIGEYDIVFDADCNGDYNKIPDLVYDPNHPGFTVVLATVGGEVYPVDKAAILLPWLGLVLLLSLAGAYLTFIKLKG